MIKNYKNALLQNKSLTNNTLSTKTFFTYRSSNAKIVYVDSIQLCDNFNTAKELKKSTGKKFNLQKTKASFFYIKFNFSETSLPKKKAAMRQFVQQKNALEQFNKYYVAEQSSKTLSRIKSYSSEFYKENKCQVITELDNKVSLLFDDGNIDITNATITYINKKYEGLK